MIFPEIVELVRNIALTLASIVGAGVALYGLFSWRNENIWKSDRDLALRLWKEIDKSRQAMFSLRMPWFSGEHLKLDAESEYGRQLGKSPEMCALENRMSDFKNKTVEMRIVAVEADACWGESISNLLKPIFDLEWQIEFAHSQIQIEENLSQAEDLHTSEARKTAFMTLGGDDFHTNYESAMDAVRSYLKLKIGRKS